MVNQRMPEKPTGYSGCVIFTQRQYRKLGKYLQFLAVFIINRHGHLNVFGCRLTPLVKIPLNQSYVDVISDVAFGKQRWKNTSFQ